MKLYGFPPSPNTWKVRAVAAHLGIPLETRIRRSDQGRLAHPGLSSRSIPPAARRRWSTAISSSWESTAIMQYLASQKPNSLWPDDARTRADIMRWQSWPLRTGARRAASR